jgi:protein phosphatase
VTRALGIEAIVPAEIAEFRVEADDIYLLCSDGLTDMVDTDVVHGVVDEQRDALEAAAVQLVDLANQNGGRDNISVILVRVPEDFLPSSGWVQRWLAKKPAAS